MSTDPVAIASLAEEDTSRSKKRATTQPSNLESIRVDFQGIVYGFS
jgi:hypothetical protein